MYTVSYFCILSSEYFILLAVSAGILWGAWGGGKCHPPEATTLNENKSNSEKGGGVTPYILYGTEVPLE